MKRIVLSIILLCFIGLGAHAQEREIVLSSRYEGNNYIISAEKFSPGTYTVLIKFSKLENCLSDSEQLFTVDMMGKTDILTLKSDFEGSYVRCSYTYSYVPGAVKPKLNLEQLYRLPLTTSKRTNVRYLGNFNQEFLGKSSAEEWKAFQFIGEPNDTIFAMRKGVVMKIVNDYEKPDLDISLTSKNNYITIQHPDGTVAKYSVVTKNSFMVSVGDIVYPDTPIALLGTFDGNKYETRVSINYPKYNKDTPDTKSPFTWVYIDPLFLTSEGATKLQSDRFYTPVVTPELISSEMTKADLKKRTIKK